MCLTLPSFFFFFNDTATTEIYTLSLHDALPICALATSELTSEQVMQTELLRLVTAGSVDDGKSTLIGRLLYDSKQVFVDQLEHVEETSRRRGDEYVNLALLTDGLRAEREQGITIDVAYRSFVTAR